MPFVSHKDKRQDVQMAEFQEEEYRPGATFGETFTAGVGDIIDENLSISSQLNRDGWVNRKAQAEALIDAGEIERDKYYRRNRRGKEIWDWDALSRDREEIKSDAELKEERNALLAQRREYAEDVFERGSGVARFLGSALAYMIDPISIVTMPISMSANGARGLAAIGRVALKAGAMEMATETGIQAFVYEHKNDIDAPYGWEDAIANISTAAIASASLSSAGMGIKEYISSVRAKSEKLPLNDSLEFAEETLERMEDTLSSNPLRKEGMDSKQLVEADAEFLRELEVRKSAYKKPEIEEPVRDLIDGDAGISSGEKRIMSKLGQEVDYQQDMLRYKERFGESIEEPPDLKGIEIDEEVRIRETGEVATLKSDAEVVYRQARKKRDQLDNIARCLGA